MLVLREYDAWFVITNRDRVVIVWYCNSDGVVIVWYCERVRLISVVRTVNKPLFRWISQTVTQTVIKEDLRVVDTRHCGEEEYFV